MIHKWVRVYLGLGSNLGNRKKNIEKALSYLKDKKEIRIIKISSLYDTFPAGDLAQGKYLNAVLCLETLFNPRQLLEALQSIEKNMGRPEKRIKWGPRIIDLDILFYANKICQTKKLIIPHPLMHERMFVLEPFKELAPGEKHPLLKKTIKKLFEELRGKDETTLQNRKR